MNNLESKIRGWFEKPYQYNSYILFCFISLAKGRNIAVSLKKLEGKTNLSNFKGRFHSLKSNTGHNDGEIFVDAGAGFVKLKDELADFILQEYKKKFSERL